MIVISSHNLLFKQLLKFVNTESYCIHSVFSRLGLELNIKSKLPCLIQVEMYRRRVTLAKGRAAQDEIDSIFGQNSNQQQSTRFEGSEPTLKGFIYDVTGERNPDQYIKTTKAIINYVGRTYTKYTTEFINAVTNLELDDPEQPMAPNPGDQIAFELWKLDIKDYRTKMQEFANFRTMSY